MRLSRFRKAHFRVKAPAGAHLRLKRKYALPAEMLEEYGKRPNKESLYEAS
jgi:hypothetical protein